VCQILDGWLAITKESKWRYTDQDWSDGDSNVIKNTQLSHLLYSLFFSTIQQLESFPPYSSFNADIEKKKYKIGPAIKIILKRKKKKNL
jgi:hypothetical protein